MPAGILGSNKGTPFLSVLDQLLNGPPGVTEFLELPLSSSKPGVLGMPSFLLPLWCSVKGCAGDVAWFSSRHMSHPSPSPSHDNSAHTVLVSTGEKLVGDGLNQNVCRILQRFLVWKAKSLSVILQHSEPYSRVARMQLWYSLTLVLVLHWDDLHMLYNIL